MKLKRKITKFLIKKNHSFVVISALGLLVALGITTYVANKNQDLKITSANFQKESSDLETLLSISEKKLASVSGELEILRNEDQFLRNEKLQSEIENIQSTYNKAVKVYDDLQDHRSKVDDVSDLEESFAEVLSKLSKRDYSGAQDTLNQISSRIAQQEKEIASQFTIPDSVPENNSPPGQGYSRQSVSVEGLGSYLVSMVAGDLSSTRVIVDTASPSDCANDCPVLSLSEYVSRNGAYAGINGTYFCPASYASCAGKTNTFDLLVMNKDKTYFNSDNNVYSNNPAVIFGDSYIRFVTAVSQWGRDTSPNGVLSNYPLLVFNSQVVFGGDDDPKKGSKGGRSFVANRGNTVYIGVVHNSTVAESARVLQTLGMENAMNLDNGGSTALWSGGYKVGPGRNLPNVLLFVNK